MRAAALALLLLAGCATPLTGPVPPGVDHVVIVSIDGLRPEFYQDGYDAPAMREMAARGVHARSVEGVYPSVTYPSHASIVTGVRPWKHGIYANTTWTEQGATRNWHWFARDLKARTLWQAAREKGRKVAITYWPTSVGAQADWVLGEVWDPEGKDTVRRLAGAASPGLLTELALAVGIPQEKIAEDKSAIDNFVSRAAAHVFRTRKPHLQLVHLLDVDEAQHREGPQGPGVRDSVRKIDGHIDRIRKAITESGVGERTLLIVVGDHGFTSISRNVNPNALLRDAGLIRVEEGRVSAWRAMARSNGGSAGIYVKDPGDVPRVEALLRSAALHRGERMYRVIERPRLDRLGYNPDAVLALDPEPGWAFSGAFTERLVEGMPTVRGNHGQLPTRPEMHTGFLAEGAGIRPGSVIDHMRLIDIAPTVAHLLGLEMPGVEGSVLQGLLR